MNVSVLEAAPFLMSAQLDQVGRDPGATWRIIPFSKWFITMVNRSPKDRVIPLANGHAMVCK